MKLLQGVALAVILSICGTAHALEGVSVKPLWTKTETASGQPIQLPQKDVRVLVSQFDIAPGAKLPVHKHPFPRYALVESGSLEVTNVDSGESNIYRKGDFIIEMIDQWHRAENVGDDPVRLIVIDQLEGEVENTLLKAMQ